MGRRTFTRVEYDILYDFDNGKTKVVPEGTPAYRVFAVTLEENVKAAMVEEYKDGRIPTIIELSPWVIGKVFPSTGEKGYIQHSIPTPRGILDVAASQLVGDKCFALLTGVPQYPESTAARYFRFQSDAPFWNKWGPVMRDLLRETAALGGYDHAITFHAGRAAELLDVMNLEEKNG